MSFIYPIIVGLIAFAGLSATCWLYDRWRQTFGGMYDDERDGSAIADQGDDWTPWPTSQPGEDSPTTNHRK
jgi:hypothetical protein